MSCERAGCNGQIVDGYSDLCGMAPARTTALHATNSQAPAAPSGAAVLSMATVSSSTAGRRPGTTRTRTAARPRLGAGLVEIPPVPFRDPADAVMKDPMVQESRRFCGHGDQPVGRSGDGKPGRVEGFCPQCRTPYSFKPKLEPGQLVAAQYEVAGCLAHGGMGWVYLARDRTVSDRWVLKFIVGIHY